MPTNIICPTIDRTKFFDTIRPMFGGVLSTGQVKGMEALIAEYEARRLTDVRWLAYVLSTVLHETGRTMQPIAEWGKGKGRRYGGKVKLNGKPYTKPDHIYYGRGHTQNTWYENYDALTRAAQLQGYEWDFLNYPDLLLQMAPSIWATFHSMLTGLYTGKKLADYFNELKSDWVGARKIINGSDKAGLIADYGKTFYKALT